MFNAALSSVVGVLGIAVAADWLSWQKRTVKLLRAHADLATALPPGEAKEALESHLAIDVDRYLIALGRRRRRKGAVLILGMTAAGVLLATAGVIANLVGGVDNWWSTALTWFGLSIEVSGVVLMKRLDDQLEPQPGPLSPLPKETSKDGAGHDEPASGAGAPEQTRRLERTDQALRYG